MPVFKGNISGSIKSTAYNLPCTIKSIGVWNRSIGAIVVNLGITDENGVDLYFKAYNLAAVSSANSSDLTLTDIRVLANWRILVTASGSCDYFISIDDK